MRRVSPGVLPTLRRRRRVGDGAQGVCAAFHGHGPEHVRRLMRCVLPPA